jgi:hypothetical protein
MGAGDALLKTRKNARALRRIEFYVLFYGKYNNQQ